MAFKNMFKQLRQSTETASEPIQADSEQIIEDSSEHEKKHTADPSMTSVDDLFPFEQHFYDVVAPENDATYLCNSTVTCPVCRSQIVVLKPLTACLSLKKVDKDLRRHYKEFNPIWYDVWCCPNCYYTALNSNFEDEKEDISFYASRIQQAMLPYKEHQILQFSNPRTVNEVLTSMYLAIRCADFYDCNLLALAKLWLHTSWLYADLGDHELFMKASDQALAAYKRVYYEARTDLPPLVEQTCFLVIGELCILQENYEEAYTSLVHAKRIENGNRLYKQNAQSRIEDVREIMAEMREKK